MPCDTVTSPKIVKIATERTEITENNPTPQFNSNNII